ncbi:flavin reductase [Streptomyces sp. NBC_01549]|uniref:flavin reductase n=1 Tax=Streptomyces sp. NBC_01549 TaxID=2975874 RepID=UPI00225A3215|nr:flavin reductase [Streptomyces sp. NBC_01549]MCX4594220.1 flavin reductase [Streptomyces sp. NBC_01549]
MDQVHRLIEPGPVILVTTQHRGIPNVMTNGFNMMIRHAPPLIGCTIGPWDHSYTALRDTGECVISIPGSELAETTVGIGNCSGQDVDKFQEFDLTPLAAQQVEAPLTAECFANIECKVADTTLVGAYNLSVATPFVAFLPAEALHVSGVLAVVTCALVTSRVGPGLIRSDARLEATAFWEGTAFLLNGALFVLVGIQTPAAVRALASILLLQATMIAAAVSATVIAARVAWFYTVPYLIRLVDRRRQQRQRRIGARQ